jgi:hypothetical protein
MDNLKIALETVFVGALALPWIFLLVQFFFPDVIEWLRHLPDFGKDQVRLTVVGVLVAALIYCLGAAVARLGQDFFNDDDLPGSVTSDKIRTSVYCDPVNSGMVTLAVPFRDGSGPYAPVTPTWFRRLCDNDRTSANYRTRQIFSLQESALLLAGADKTSRLRLLHQQMMILRGAAFDGVLTCILFLIGWFMQHQNWGGWRYVLPIAIFLLVARMLCSHFHIHPFASQSLWQSAQFEPGDPPFMELTFLLLGVCASCVVGKVNQASWKYGTGLRIALLLTGLAYAGWYWTEIMYDQLVLYSYFAGSTGLLKLAP